MRKIYFIYLENLSFMKFHDTLLRQGIVMGLYINLIIFIVHLNFTERNKYMYRKG